MIFGLQPKVCTKWIRVVADDGEVIIFAPHINEVSYTHGELIDEIGYHCRDDFLEAMGSLQRLSGCVLAHSTHLKGMGRSMTGERHCRCRGFV